MVDPSLYVPVAVNWTDFPSWISALAGLTVMAVKVGVPGGIVVVVVEVVVVEDVVVVVPLLEVVLDDVVVELLLEVELVDIVVVTMITAAAPDARPTSSTTIKEKPSQSFVAGAIKEVMALS